GNVEQLAINLKKIIEIMPEDVVIIPGHGRNYSMNDLREYQKMLKSTFEIVSGEIKKGRTLEEMQRSDILADYKKWGHERNPCSNWIRTVHYCITKGGK
ncbi:hypothetical protein ACFL6O_03960, partial [candidate division KSB1 bacterium]